MTAEEAVGRLRKRICCEKPVQHFCTDNCMSGENECEISLAINALEKQIPKKPDLVEFTKGTVPVTIAYCPNCRNSFGELKPSMCIYIEMQLSAFKNNELRACNCCGQALDWSDTK